MSEFLGCRISLISKSDIRYVGTLHEINSTESTVSLENVMSFGTEGRKGGEEIAPSDQIYEYIVFRGSDVKDLRIEEHPAVKENKPPAIPDDPAIVSTRPRLAPQGLPSQGPAFQGPSSIGQAPPSGPLPGSGNFGQPPFHNNFYGGPPAPWGRGGPSGPGVGVPGVPPGPHPFGGLPYPPPPGWMPPGPSFPGGPRPWNPYQFPPGPGVHDPNVSYAGGAQDNKPVPIGPAADRNKAAAPAPAVPAEPDSLPQTQAPAPIEAPPPPPIESNPSVEEVKAIAESLPPEAVKNPPKAVPTGPKSNRVITPVIPLATAIPKSEGPKIAELAVTSATATVSGPTLTIKDATEAARAAVASAMSQLPGREGIPVDNLTKRVNDMRINAAKTSRGPHLGRGRGGRGGRPYHSRLPIPDSDFDFDQANAKFNKDGLWEEVQVGVSSPGAAECGTDEAAGTLPSEAVYDKKKSFFDNIGSEAKDRSESGGQKPGGREWRSEEHSKNIETFGEGRADEFRPRRGRGNRSRGGYGYGRGGRGGYRNQALQQVEQ